MSGNRIAAAIDKLSNIINIFNGLFNTNECFFITFIDNTDYTLNGTRPVSVNCRYNCLRLLNTYVYVPARFAQVDYFIKYNIHSKLY